LDERRSDRVYKCRRGTRRPTKKRGRGESISRALLLARGKKLRRKGARRGKSREGTKRKLEAEGKGEKKGPSWRSSGTRKRGGKKRKNSASSRSGSGRRYKREGGG